MQQNERRSMNDFEFICVCLIEKYKIPAAKTILWFAVNIIIVFDKQTMVFRFKKDKLQFEDFSSVFFFVLERKCLCVVMAMTSVKLSSDYHTGIQNQFSLQFNNRAMELFSMKMTTTTKKTRNVYALA